MITTSVSTYTSAVIPLTASSFPNVFIGITGSDTCDVKLQRECEDGVYRSYRDTEYSRPGARALSLPAGNYKLVVAAGPVVVEVKQL